MSRKNTRQDVLAWAGPAADEIDDDTADKIASLWDQIVGIYGTADEEGDELGAQEAATGAAMLVLGDINVAQAGREWQAAHVAAAAAQDHLTGVILAALDAGTTRQEVCTTLGIARTTLNRWLAPRR